jgi:hypothetical protein
MIRTLKPQRNDIIQALMGSLPIVMMLNLPEYVAKCCSPRRIRSSSVSLVSRTCPWHFRGTAGAFYCTLMHSVAGFRLQNPMNLFGFLRNSPSAKSLVSLCRTLDRVRDAVEDAPVVRRIRARVNEQARAAKRQVFVWQPE